MKTSLKKINLENCPYCGGKPTICSHGGVNCPDCMQFIRMLNEKELIIFKNNIKKLKTIYAKDLT